MAKIRYEGQMQQKQLIKLEIRTFLKKLLSRQIHTRNLLTERQLISCLSL